jgi:hypothetical protein
MVGIPDRVGYVAHNPWQRSLGIQGASNHEFGRHALLGSRLRFTDATFLTGDGQPRCSAFPGSTSQLTELNK